MQLIALSKEQFDRIEKEIAEIKAALSKERKNDIYDNADVIQLLKISARTLATWRDSGTIRYSKVGAKIFYRRADIEHLLDETINR